MDRWRRHAPGSSEKATALGLYDMAGNVAEMVSDLYQELKEKNQRVHQISAELLKGALFLQVNLFMPGQASAPAKTKRTQPV